MADRVVHAVDAWQRRHRWLGFPLGVIYKFADDQGTYLTALITHYGGGGRHRGKSDTATPTRRRTAGLTLMVSTDKEEHDPLVAWPT